MTTSPAHLTATTEYWRPAPNEPAWCVRMHWREVSGRMECIGIELRSFLHTDELEHLGDRVPGIDYRDDGTADELWMPPADEAAGVVSTTLLRLLPLGELMHRSRTGARETTRIASLLGRVDADEAQRALDAFDRGKRGGRPRQYDAQHWAEVAQVYTEAWQRGDPPTLAVARHFNPTHSEDRLPKSTAAKWVARCRQLGLLPETSKGRPNARRDQG